jgi:hypothetical protein
MTDDWTTRVEYTHHGIELHSAWFIPKGWPGKGPVVNLLIPECELQLTVLSDHDGEPATLVNRPPKNKNVKMWVRTACEMTIEHGACLFLTCDTAEQVERFAEHAMRRLPNYKRMPLERFYRPEDRRDVSH